MINRHLLAITMIMAFTGSTHIAKAQGMAINTSGTAADTSAMLDVTSTSKGVLIPRMTTAQRNAIVTPATGLMVFQTDGTAGFYYYNGSAWTAVSGGSPTGTASGDLTGTYPGPTLTTSGVTAGTYGSTTQSPQITVDAKGRITAVTNQTIAGGGSGGYFFNNYEAPGTGPSNPYTNFAGLLTGQTNIVITGANFNQTADVISGTVTLDAMYVQPFIYAVYASGAANVYTGTVFKNGSATAMTVTFTTGTTNPLGANLSIASDVAHTVSLVAGDRVAVRWVQSNTTGGELAYIAVSFHGH